MSRVGRFDGWTAGLSLLAAVATTPGCAGERTLAVRLVREAGIPPAGLEITVFPVDPEALLDSLARAARRPKPVFPDLQQEMLGFRDDRSRDTTGALYALKAWATTRDSVEALADTLRSVDRASLAYREAYGRLRGLYQRLAQRGAERDRALRGGLGGERDLALRAARAADSLRRWEQVAYADFDARMERALRRSGRDVRQAVTDSAGMAELALPPGRWWIQARVRDPRNPFLERAWNVPVTLTALVPVALPLLGRTAVIRWRH